MSWRRKAFRALSFVKYFSLGEISVLFLVRTWSWYVEESALVVLYVLAFLYCTSSTFAAVKCEVSVKNQIMSADSTTL